MILRGTRVTVNGIPIKAKWEADMVLTFDTLPDRLPKPDSYGNYWLGGKAHGPAVLKGRPLGGKERWFISTAEAEDVAVVFAGHEIRYFDSPEGAFKFLKEQL